MRAICEVLGLDKALEEEVAVLRRNLLRLTHTREFSAAAKFQVRIQYLNWLRMFLLFSPPLPNSRSASRIEFLALLSVSLFPLSL